MAITVDQLNVGEFAQDTASGTIALTTSAAVASNAFIVLMFSWLADTSQTLSSVSGGSLSWSIDKQGRDAVTQAATAVVSAQAPAGLASSTAITGTLSGSSPGGRSISATSFLGVKTLSALDTTSGPTAYTTAGWSTDSISIAAGSVIVAAVVDFTDLRTNTPTSPSVEMHDFGVGGGFGTCSEYRLEASAGSYTVAGTWSAVATGVINAAAYLEAPSGVDTGLAWIRA